MAIIGCLGDIVFEVSESPVRTLNNMIWSGSARYATHNRHLNHALTEFTGLDPDKFKFDITFSAELGTDPMNEVVKLWNIKRSGEAVPLTIGTKPYGKFRWNLLNLQMKTKAYYRNGDIHTATVSVSLQEYLGD